MKKLFLLFSLLLIVSLLIFSACSPTPGGSTTSRPSAPASYTNKTNPYSGNTDAISKGKVEYSSNCISCHGELGGGDGPAASALTPKPSNLKLSIKEATAGYIFWRISDGGGMDPFKSSMPAFKATLGEEKIWQVVSYMQTLK